MPTSNKDMADLMRKRRSEMADLPAYEGPSADVAVAVKTEPADPEAESASETKSSGITVMAPGEPSTGDGFEYEPLTDTPGAWAVYPPGVPCDEAEYRISMNRPAAAADFEKMQKAIEDAGGTTSDVPPEGPAPSEPAESEVY